MTVAFSELAFKEECHKALIQNTNTTHTLLLTVLYQANSETEALRETELHELQFVIPATLISLQLKHTRLALPAALCWQMLISNDRSRNARPENKRHHFHILQNWSITTKLNFTSLTSASSCQAEDLQRPRLLELSLFPPAWGKSRSEPTGLQTTPSTSSPSFYPTRLRAASPNGPRPAPLPFGGGGTLEPPPPLPPPPPSNPTPPVAPITCTHPLGVPSPPAPASAAATRTRPPRSLRFPALGRSRQPAERGGTGAAHLGRAGPGGEGGRRAGRGGARAGRGAAAAAAPARAARTGRGLYSRRRRAAMA